MHCGERLRLAGALLAPEITFERLHALRCEDPPVPTYHEGIAEPCMRRVLQLMAPAQTDALLDLGCGAGRWLALASEVCSCRLLGIEYVEGRASAARRVVEGTGATILQGDGLDADVWRRRPTHVVFVSFDSTTDEAVRFWRRVATTPSVVCVATWTPKPVHEAKRFALAGSLRTVATTGDHVLCHIWTRQPLPRADADEKKGSGV